MRKLTVEQVHEIQIDPRMHRIIAQHYGISESHVSSIKHGRRWSSKYVCKVTTATKLLFTIDLFDYCMDAEEIAEETGRTLEQVQEIIRDMVTTGELLRIHKYLMNKDGLYARRMNGMRIPQLKEVVAL